VTRRVVVVGGGITGLTAAWDLQRGGARVTLVEASSHLGGKLLTSPVGDRAADAGPDTFLARVPQGRVLCEELGLADELTSPISPVPAYLYRDASLHPLPAGTVLGVPTDLEALARSGAVSPEGAERAALDLTLDPTELTGDVSIGEVARARLGDEVTDRLLDPLIGGINAGSVDTLSLDAGAPQLAAVLRRTGSFIAGLRGARAGVGATLGSAGRDEPVFYGLPGGIARVTERLVEVLTDSDLCADTVAESVERTTGGYLVRLANARGIEADAVLLTTPAHVTGPLLASCSPGAGREHEAIPYASVAQVTVEYPRDAIDEPLDASGVLVPRVDGFVLTASTWFSTKWAHYAHPDRLLIRLTSGRYQDDRAMRLDDETLVRTLRDELQRLTPLRGEPTALRVHRWVDALPQYLPGHLDRVARIEAALDVDAPGVRVAGAAYRGVGIPACIAQARQAAAALLA
jgi:protoporphyrinogen/coproporphyrinogen III oxidase